LWHNPRMSSAQPTPILRIGTPAFYQDPYPTYRALLDSGTRAVRLSPQIVAVTQYHDCMDVLHDPRLSAKREERQVAHFDEEQKRDLASWTRLLQDTVLFMDPPDHPRIRKLLHRFFSPEVLSAMATRIELIFQELLEAVPVGIEIDFMSRLAHPLPALVVGEILGVPRSNWDLLLQWSDAVADFLRRCRLPSGSRSRRNRPPLRWRP